MALDLATACGIAEGMPGGEPRASNASFAVEGGGYFGAGERALIHFSERFAAFPPAVVFIERPGLHSIGKGGTAFQVIFRLLGLIFLVGTVARARGVYDVRLVEVKDIRSHFLGGAAIPGEQAKRLTQIRCRELGYAFATPDEADAIALWDYGCEQIKPGSGHKAPPNLYKTLAAVAGVSLARKPRKRGLKSAALALFAKPKRGRR
jgi:hypothetical protein